MKHVWEEVSKTVRRPEVRTVYFETGFRKGNGAFHTYRCRTCGLTRTYDWNGKRPGKLPRYEGLSCEEAVLTAVME